MAMTLGEFRDALARCPQDAIVVYRDLDLRYTRLSTWRGSYSEPAIGYATPSSHSDTPTVAAVLSEIDEALSGRVYHGYKGGAYRFHRDQVVRVDNYDAYHKTVLTGVEMLSTRWACLVFEIEAEW